MIKRRMPGNSSANQVNRAVAAKANPKINIMNKDGRMIEQSYQGGGQLANTSMSNNVINLDLFPLLKGVIPDGYENFPLLNNLYRDIYYYDSVCGSAADLMSFMPFSDMTLGGVEAGDKAKLTKFYESLDRINVRRLLPELSIDYLVLGTFIGSMVFNKDRGIFTDVIPQDIDHCLHGHTKVLTDKGWKTMLELAEPIPEGQRGPTTFPINYNINGKLYPGSAPYYKGRQHTYRIILSNGQELIGTSDHRILTFKKNPSEVWSKNHKGEPNRFLDKKQWVQIKGLKPGDRLVLSEATPSKIEKTKEFYEHYFLGVQMGDGTGKKSPNIRLYKKDKKEIYTTLEKAGVIGKVGFVFDGEKLKSSNTKVHFNNRGKELMAKYHYSNKLSVDIQNETQLMGYLSGLIVSDGWVGPGIHIAGATEYIQQLFDLLLQYGYVHCDIVPASRKGSIYNIKGKTGARTKDMDILNIKRTSIVKMLDNLELTKTKRKKLLKHIFSVQPKKPYATVVSVTPCGHNHVYDITVPGKERFNANGVIVHNCQISPLPFYSQDPIIKVNIAKETISALGGTSKRVERIKKKMGKEVIDKLLSGSFELDNLTTLYVPRKTLSSREGISWFKRILPVYLLEKNLFKGTIIESAKRQRSIMHITAGSSDWEPTINDLQFLTELFMNADADPIGAMVATRSDVNVNDIRQGGDFWNVTQVWADTVPAKLRALGISEGFLSSESNYSEAQNSMTVFIEWLAAFRYMIERKVFYDKLFPLISVVNGYYKTEKDQKKWKNSEMDPEDILYEVQDNSALMIPKIHWHKQLKVEGDSDYLGMLNQLTEAGVPVTLRSLAAAGNLSLDQLMSEMEDDIKMRKQVADMKAKLEGGGGGEGGDAGEEDPGYSEESRALIGDRLSTLSTISANNPYMSAALSKIKGSKGNALRNITQRSYGSDSEIKGTTKTGKVKYVHNQKQANDKVNTLIAKAAAASHGIKGGKKSIFPTIKLR